MTFTPIFILSAMFSAGLVSQATANAWDIEISNDRWELVGFEEDRDLSGITTSDGRNALVVADERHSVQAASIERESRQVTAGTRVTLLGEEAGDRELDLEAVAFDASQRCYFAVGSHGVSKKLGNVEPDRNHVFRIPLEAGTGRIREDRVARASLKSWLENHPVLGRFAGQPLQRGGINIEGLAARDGMLFFGLRAPNVDGRGFVIEIPADELFAGDTSAARVHELELGEGRGIREIVHTRHGLLIVTGNAAAESVKRFPESAAPEPDIDFELLLWSGRSGAAPERLGSLPRTGGKAEAVLVIEESARALELLVVFDGLPAGAPLAVRLIAR